MRMYTRLFNSLREAEDFVNENKIAKEDIVCMIPDDGAVSFVYYGE